MYGYIWICMCVVQLMISAAVPTAPLQLVLAAWASYDSTQARGHGAIIIIYIMHRSPAPTRQHYAHTCVGLSSGTVAARGGCGAVRAARAAHVGVATLVMIG